MRIASCLLFALPVMLPAAARAQTERHVLQGDRPIVYDLVGEVRIEKGSGPDVVVELTRGGGGGARLQVVTPGGHELRVIFPDDQIVYPRLRNSNDEVQVHDDGTFGSGSRGGHQVRISGHGSGVEAWADLRLLVPAGKRVEVHLGVGRMVASAVTGDLRLDALSGDISVDGTRGTLNVSTGSGDIEARSIEGDLTLDTGSGDIRLDEGRGGRLRLDTGSGDIRGSGLDYRNQSFDTGSGDVTLAGVAADDVDVDSGSGDVEIRFTRDLASLRIETGSGDVTLDLPATAGAALDLQTSSGDLDTELPITISRKSEDHLVGTIGDGRGRIRVETSSGDVRLRRE